ncbi:hypothetical protein GEMRC1_003968 [Eukaryota sp. GEM-RC1]
MHRRVELILGFTLFFFIGFAPFAVINGLWAQVPIFEANLPEKEGIGTTIGFLVQLGQHLPLYLLAVVLSLFTALFWDSSLPFWDSDTHSLGVILSSFAAGFVGCTSMVTLFSFVKQYNRTFVSAVSVGMASSGMLTSYISLVQKVGDDPIFGPRTFFLIMSFFLTFSLVSLIVTPLFLKKSNPYQTDLLMVNGEEAEDLVSTSSRMSLFQLATEPLLNIFFVSVFFTSSCLVSYPILLCHSPIVIESMLGAIQPFNL